MTDLVVAVRLKADGSGLVGQMRLSKEAVDELKAATTQAGNAAQGMAADLGRAGAAAEKAAGSTDRAASSVLDLAIANARAERASKELATAQAALAAAAEQSGEEQARAANEVAAAQARLTQAQGEVTRASRQAEAAGASATRSLGQQRAGYQQLGFQIQDITQSIALGTSGFTILAQQGGQTASALDQLGLKGAGGRVASFFAGPWGAVFLAATAVLGPFVIELFNTKKAMEEVTLAGDVLADAQGVLGKAFDLTTGKLKANSEALLLNARAKEINLRASAQERQQTAITTFASGGDASTITRLLATGAILNGQPNLIGALPFGNEIGALGRRAEQARLLLSPSRSKEEQARGLREIDQLIQEANRADFSGTSTTRKKFIEALLGVVTARQENDIANLINKSLSDGKLAPELRQERKPKKPSGALAQFGESTGDRLDALTTRYTDLPAPVREAEQSLNQLNAIAREVEQRKPPNYAELKQQIDATRAAIIGGRDRGLGDAIEKIADGFDQTGAAAKRAAQGSQQLDDIVRYLNANLGKNPGFAPLIEQADRAKAAIEASVLKPYRDVIESQQEQLAIGEALKRGREDEAQALQIINNLRRAGLKLTEDQQRAILLGVQAQRQQQRELEALQRRQQSQLNFLGDVRGSITRAFAGESTDIAGDIVQAFRRAFAEQLTEKLFGKLFADLTDKIVGRTKIDDPAAQFKNAINKTLDPLDRFATTVDRAAGAAGAGATTNGGSAASLVALLGRTQTAPFTAVINALTGAQAIGRRSFIDENGDVVVTGLRKATNSIDGLVGQLRELLVKGFKLDSGSVNKLGDLLGTGVKGAGTGLAIAGIGQSLGIKLDSTGSAIGGAIGNFLPIPGGSIIGSIAGGLLGGLFAPTPKAKSGAITSTDGKVEISGNNGDAKNSVAQAVGQVQSGLQQIADQLGAQIGGFSVSIAKYKDSFRVDPTGSGSDGGKYGDRFVQGIGKFDNNDIQGAVSFAIADAIKDGAIKGISPAVAKALQSSTDVNKALREALKVRDLEAFIGGPAAALKKAFDDFDLLAQERVGLAKKYGLDLVELEKKTAEARTKLVEDSLKSSVGSIQQLLDNIRFGDLFEGTAAEQRRKLLAELDKAQADQAAGVEGAADRYASLGQQLIGKSRDSYGTAGPEYNADRARVISGGEAIIKAEQERLDRAAGLQQASLVAAQQSNTLLDEGNGLAAMANGKLDTLINLLERGQGSLSGVTTNGGNYGNWFDAPQLSLTVRNALA